MPGTGVSEDVHRAHCYADAVRDVCVQLLDEDRKSKEQGACGYGSSHEAGGFSRGVAPPSPFSTWAWKFAGAESGTGSVARCRRAEPGHNFGPGVDTLPGSQFLGLNIDNAEEENRVRARPATCVSRIEGSGHTCARGVATLGIGDVGGVPNTRESSELRRTAKWHEPPEEIEEEDDLLTGDELKVLQTLVLAIGQIFQKNCERIDAENVFTTQQVSPRQQKSSSKHNQFSKNGLQRSVG